MADFEGDLLLVGKLSPRVFGDEVETVQVDRFAVLCFRVVTVGDVDDITFDIFFDNEPGTAAQSETFALPDRVKPVAVVFA